MISIEPSPLNKNPEPIRQTVTPRQALIRDGIIKEAKPESDSGTEDAPKGATNDASSSRFAQLSRREQQLRQQMKDLKKREEDIEKMEEGKLSSRTFAEKLRSAPLEAIEEAGISHDQLLSLLANGPEQPSAISMLEKEIQALKDQMGQSQKQQEERQAKSYEQAISQIRSEVQALVDGSDEFETIKALDLSDSVVEHIKQTWEKEQRLIPTAEALKEIEEHYMAEALKLLNIRKFRDKVTTVDVSDGKTQDSQLAARESKSSMSRTLTNATASAQKPMNRMERALAAFQGRPINK